MSQSDELHRLREALLRAEQAARLAAYHDGATGLPNRRLLDDRLTQAMRVAQRRDRLVAVLLLQLDEAGDVRLREAAQRLAPCLRKADTLARTGADELAVVLCDVRDEAECRGVAGRLLGALGTLGASASIGISLYPAHGDDSEALLRNAETARSRARQLGRNQFLLYGR